jgi:hypothetical protein
MLNAYLVGLDLVQLCYCNLTFLQGLVKRRESQAFGSDLFMINILLSCALKIKQTYSNLTNHNLCYLCYVNSSPCQY